MVGALSPVHNSCTSFREDGGRYGKPHGQERLCNCPHLPASSRENKPSKLEVAGSSPVSRSQHCPFSGSSWNAGGTPTHHRRARLRTVRRRLGSGCASRPTGDRWRSRESALTACAHTCAGAAGGPTAAVWGGSPKPRPHRLHPPRFVREPGKRLRDPGKRDSKAPTQPREAFGLHLQPIAVAEILEDLGVGRAT
jgi:hypothetical protein